MNNFRRPLNPISIDEWKNGTSSLSTIFKVKYTYSDGDSFKTIARKLAGQSTPDPVLKKYAFPMTWKDIARINYSTENQFEINYYLKEFNGCRSNGKNYVLSSSDAENWLWIPTAGICSVTPVRIPSSTAFLLYIPPPSSEFTRFLMEIFSAIDRDDDGELTSDDLWSAVSSPYIRGSYAAAVSTAVIENIFKILISSNDDPGIDRGLTKADLRAFDVKRNRIPNDPDIQSTLNLFDDFQNKLNSIQPEIFKGMPNAFKIRQGYVGDCWLISAIVGLTQRDPNDLLRLIDQNTCGDTYKIKFPQLPEQTVTRPTDSEILLLATTESGLWLTLLEKAWGQIDYGSILTFFQDSSISTLNAGNSLKRGIELLTGNSADFDGLIFTSIETTRNKLENAIRNKKVVTAGIAKRFYKFIFPDNSNDWPDQHAYSIIDYSRSTDMISIRNPWGNTGPIGGINITETPYSIPLPEFISKFSFIAYEE